MTIWSSTQNPHILRTFIAAMTGLGQDHVRAIAPEVGGGFGAKINIYGEEYVAAAVSKRLGIPVKWSEERSEAVRRAAERHRDGARPQDETDGGHRPLQHAPHGRHPDADDADGQCHLRYPGDP